MLPTPRSTTAEIGSGVWKVCCMACSFRLAGPARVALGSVRCASLPPLGRVGPFETRGGRPDQPRVDRQALAVGRPLDLSLQALGQAQVDARDLALALVAGVGRCLVPRRQATRVD